MKRGFFYLSLVAGVLICSSSASAQEGVLSLEEAVRVAKDNSTIVGVSREQLQSARQNVLNNLGRFLPNASVSTYAGRTFIGPSASVAFDTQGRPIDAAGFDFESYSFSVSSNLNLFDWGVNVKSLNSAKRSAEAAEFDLAYQGDIVTALVIREYYNYVKTRNLSVVQRESVAAAQRNLEQVEAFFRIGSNTRADVLQAKVRLGNTQLTLITAENNEEIARATLASRLNFGLDREFDVSDEIEIRKVAPDFDAEVAYMLEHRSDLLASRRRVKAAGSSITAARNGRWPTLAATMSYSWNDRQYPDNSNFFKNDYSWNVGVVVDYNLFDRFATKSAILNADAQGRIAEYNLQQAKLDAILEAKTIILGLEEADERMRVSGETVAQAKENLRLAEERYRVGAGTILETIEAGVSLTEARSSLIEAQIDYLISKADLLRATGRPVTTD
ncbi:MAG: TolC family protein [Candidatus Krumholzibacteriia bacterium]